MQITLKQDEIEKGIVALLSNMGINTQNTEITIQLQAGRKGNGHSAIVDIESLDSNEEEYSYTETAEPAPSLEVVESTEKQEPEQIFA